MRADVVVMAYGFGYGAISLHCVAKAAPRQIFVLHDAVHALGYGVVCGVAVLVMLMAAPSTLSLPTYRWLQYWMPRSLWWIS